jgi:biotin carboxyl carrier protein
MTFEIELAGTRRAVSIDREGPGRFRIVLDGTTHTVLAERAGEYGLSVIVDEGSGISREVSVAPGSASGEVLVGVGGRTTPVTVNGRRLRAAQEGGAHADGLQSVAAPMPGRVVRVLVALGDEVAARQGVVVVEAMKMENELRAPADGVVAELHVEEGQSVDAGTLLVVLGAAQDT